LNELLDVPEYNKELGFVHQVEADLKRVLESLPDKSRKILIFIDDLDRCYPDKVAQVMSAVNLFLAGDFANCYFVLGMDTEMVAAALQAAHRDMISFLLTDAGIPVGWRFMDKFVQLPVLLLLMLYYNRIILIHC
jgi:predicted KAP-like P-loop ATPase